MPPSDPPALVTPAELRRYVAAWRSRGKWPIDLSLPVADLIERAATALDAALRLNTDWQDRFAPLLGESVRLRGRLWAAEARVAKLEEAIQQLPDRCLCLNDYDACERNKRARAALRTDAQEEPK